MVNILFIMSLLIDCLLDLHEMDAAWLYKGIEQGLSMSKWREKYVSKYSKSCSKVMVSSIHLSPKLQKCLMLLTLN